ncbi:MAG TPA: hypothetical protein DCM14_00790 [Clostridiales bacterium UBA8153]|nr:hypothetical protein [Clostridiales bacterium UBA8153]
MLQVLLASFFIFAARVTDVTLGTLRVLLIVRGRKYQAAALGFFEVTIFLGALTMVVRDMDNPIKVVAYALGFATGNILGSVVEERLALGYVTAQIICMRPDASLDSILREEGFGVTVLQGQGREGSRKVLLVTVARKSLATLHTAIETHDPEAFFTVMETRSIYGGVFQSRKGK